VFLLIAFVLMSLQYPSGDFMPPKFVIDTGINFANEGSNFCGYLTGSRKNLPPHCAVFLLIAFVLMSLQYPSGDFMPPKFVIDTGINFAQRGGWHTVWYRKVNTCVPHDRYGEV